MVEPGLRPGLSGSCVQALNDPSELHSLLPEIAQPQGSVYYFHNSWVPPPGPLAMATQPTGCRADVNLTSVTYQSPSFFNGKMELKVLHPQNVTHMRGPNTVPGTEQVIIRY